MRSLKKTKKQKLGACGSKHRIEAERGGREGNRENVEVNKNHKKEKKDKVLLITECFCRKLG